MKVIRIEEGIKHLSHICVVCNETQEFTVPKAEHDKWVNGEQSVQNAMASISPEIRELFLSGICATCYSKLNDE